MEKRHKKKNLFKTVWCIRSFLFLVGRRKSFAVLCCISTFYDVLFSSVHSRCIEPQTLLACERMFSPRSYFALAARNDARAQSTRKLYYAVTHIMASQCVRVCCFIRLFGPYFPRFMEIMNPHRKDISTAHEFISLLEK